MSVHCTSCGREIRDHKDGKLTTQLRPVVRTARLCQSCWDSAETVDIVELLDVKTGGNS